jgi:hypothetical protein
MSWEEYVCPIGYTPLAQIIVAFVLALILSYFTHSFLIILAFLIIYEIAYAVITVRYDNDRWHLFARIGVVIAYVAGWIVGRALLGFPSAFISRDYDHACDMKFISH